MNENWASATIQLILRGTDEDGQPIRIPREISLRELDEAMKEALAAPPPIDPPKPPVDRPDDIKETGGADPIGIPVLTIGDDA